MKTVEGNKLIAEFMGFDIDFDRNNPDSKNLTIPSELKDYNFDNGYSGYKFHTSWDWLMPVLKKISQALFSEFSDSVRNQWKMIESPTLYNIEHVYKQAVEFIKWYNENK